MAGGCAGSVLGQDLRQQGQDLHAALPRLPVLSSRGAAGVNIRNLCRWIFKSRVELWSSDLFIHSVRGTSIFRRNFSGTREICGLSVDKHKKKTDQKPPRAFPFFFFHFMAAHHASA